MVMCPSSGVSRRATDLLPQLQDLESLKVVELLPLLVLSALLCPCGLRPLLVHLSLRPCRLDGADSSAAGELGENDRGERQVGEGCGLARDTAVLRGAVNQHLAHCEPCTEVSIAQFPYPLVVDDLDDGS